MPTSSSGGTDLYHTLYHSDGSSSSSVARTMASLCTRTVSHPHTRTRTHTHAHAHTHTRRHAHGGTHAEARTRRPAHVHTRTAARGLSLQTPRRGIAISYPRQRWRFLDYKFIDGCGILAERRKVMRTCTCTPLVWRGCGVCRRENGCFCECISMVDVCNCTPLSMCV